MKSINQEDYQNINDLIYRLELQFKQSRCRAQVCKELLINSPIEDIRISLEIEKIFSSLMLKRNLIGKEWEDSGQDFLAIKAYEKNVFDSFEGSFPYERLRILYSKYGFYEKAINVCKKYLSLPNHPLGYDEKKRSRFNDYLIDFTKKKKTADINKENAILLMNNLVYIPIDEFILRGKKISKSSGKAKYEINNTRNGTIEEFVLTSQIKDGVKGLWSENHYWWFIMSLLFWDIIFLPIPGMFYTKKGFPWQDMPLDFFDIDFYIRRSDEINSRLNEIDDNKSAGSKNVINILKKYYAEYKGIPCRPIEDWERYSLDDLLLSLEILTPQQLASIMKRLLLFFNDYRKGLPDLFLVMNNEPFFIECKEKDEKISDWQKSWHHYLMTQTKIPVKICRVENSEQLINNF